jgi:hypothetical protein
MRLNMNYQLLSRRLWKKERRIQFVITDNVYTHKYNYVLVLHINLNIKTQSVSFLKEEVPASLRDEATTACANATIRQIIAVSKTRGSALSVSHWRCKKFGTEKRREPDDKGGKKGLARVSTGDKSVSKHTYVCACARARVCVCVCDGWK